MGEADRLVQHQCSPFGGGQPLEHGERAQREQVPALHDGQWVLGDGVAGEHGLRQPDAGEPLVPLPGGAQLVQADPGHDLDEPGARIAHRCGRAVVSKPALLDHVLGVGRAAQQPVRNGEEQGAQRGEDGFGGFGARLGGAGAPHRLPTIRRHSARDGPRTRRRGSLPASPQATSLGAGASMATFVSNRVMR